MKVATYRIRNTRTNETLVVDQSQYNTPYGRFQSLAFGGDWEIVRENNEGGEAGYQASKAHHDMVAGLKWKRERNPLRAS